MKIGENRKVIEAIFRLPNGRERGAGVRIYQVTISTETVGFVLR